MAVYTKVVPQALDAFMGEYDLGAVLSLDEIAEGIENSNFLLVSERGRYILTLYERRVKADELPWFLGLMRHLSSAGLPCPVPVAGRDGETLRSLMGRPAAITTFLPGRPVQHMDVQACRALGAALARFHILGAGYGARRANALGVSAWKPLLKACGDAGDSLVAGLTQRIAAIIDDVEVSWPQDRTLPVGQIHADLFPDNVFFQDGNVSGIIDFYFACSDIYAYDLAICLNAWCFRDEEFCEPERVHALLEGYGSERSLTDGEWRALPVLAQGAAIRFLLTRLYDWGNTPADALVVRKDPLPYLRRLEYWRQSGGDVFVSPA